MKKTGLALLIFIFCNILLIGQNGSGTVGDPYYGTITGNQTWDPGDYDEYTIYAHDLVIGTGFTLTIEGSSNLGHLDFFGGAYSLTINNGATFTIEPGAAVTVGSITNNGTLRLESYAAEGAAASLILSGYSGTGVTQTQLFLSGGSEGGNKWHYISTPVSNFNIGIFTANTQNLAQYIESDVNSIDNRTGWVAYDGYRYIGTGTGPTFSTLLLGKGYDYYDDTDQDYLIEGQLNYANVNVNLTCGNNFINYQGFNLIGNPFSSYINWDLIVPSLPLTVNDAIYFTNNDEVVSYVNGVHQGATNYIPPMQGFFVKMNTPGTASLTLPASAREYDPFFQIRYKGSGDRGKGPVSIPLVRLKLEDQADSTDLVVRFDEEATTGVDKRFDALKFSKTGSRISTWTKTDNVDFAINGLPFPESSVDIPVGIFVASAGIYKLTSNELKNLDNYNIILKDNLTGITVDLKKGGQQEFSAPQGASEARFVLTVKNISTGVADISLSKKKFRVYSSPGKINIISLTDEFCNSSGSVCIYDLTGKQVLNRRNVVWQSGNELKQIDFNNFPGLYIIEINAGNKRFVEKVNIRR